MSLYYFHFYPFTLLFCRPRLDVDRWTCKFYMLLGQQGFVGDAHTNEPLPDNGLMIISPYITLAHLRSDSYLFFVCCLLVTSHSHCVILSWHDDTGVVDAAPATAPAHETQVAANEQQGVFLCLLCRVYLYIPLHCFFVVLDETLVDEHVNFTCFRPTRCCRRHPERWWPHLDWGGCSRCAVFRGGNDGRWGPPRASWFVHHDLNNL